MRKMLSVFGVLALVLTVGAMTASAQTQVSLGPTANGSIAFTGNSGNVSINLGSCSSGTCTLHGLSTILPPLPAGPDSYTIVQTGAIGLASNGTVTQANPISFSYNSGTGLTLTGTLQLVNFIQVGASGLFNDNLLANLSNLGGNLASTFTSQGGPNAVTSITIVVQSGANVFNLFSTNGTAFAHISTGAIVPAPESSTLVLFGTGLLAVGFLLWRRNGIATQQTVAL
jgi:hypothetical protein